MSISVCVAGHTSKQTSMGLVASGNGKATNQNTGLAGGYPGNTQLDIAIRGSRVRDLISQGRLPSRLDELGGEREVLPCEGESLLLPGDALFAHCQAGGGYGDPLRQDPAVVATDVAAFKVSVEAARIIYGVVFDPATNTLDEAATEARRAEMLASRRERAEGQEADGGAASGAPAPEDARLDDNLAIVYHDGDELVACVHCGHEIGKRDENYLENLVVMRALPAKADRRSGRMLLPMWTRRSSSASCVALAASRRCCPPSYPWINR